MSARRVTVPNERRYLETGFGRLLVLDLVSRTAAELGWVDTGPSGNSGVSLSESADGRVVLLTVFRDERDDVVFLLRPEQGEVEGIFHGHLADLALIAPDGETFALALISSDPAAHGVWLGRVVTGIGRRIVADDPARGSSPPVPLAFSPHADVLAIALSGGPGDHHVVLLRTDAGEARYDARTGQVVGAAARIVGPGQNVDGLREGGPLLIASSRDAFGGESVVYRTEHNGTGRRDIHRSEPDVVIERALWRPDGGGAAIVERSLMFRIGGESRVLVLDDAGAIVHDAGYVFLVDLWWSGDGTRLFGRVGGDDSTGVVIEVIGGGPGMSYCLRGRDRPSCL